VFFSDEDHGWISGGYFYDSNNYQFILLKTVNGGESWNEIRDFNYLSNDMYFADSLNGWASGADSSGAGIIIKTTDGGETWSAEAGNLSAPLNALYFGILKLKHADPETSLG